MSGHSEGGGWYSKVPYLEQRQADDGTELDVYRGPVILQGGVVDDSEFPEEALLHSSRDRSFAADVDLSYDAFGCQSPGISKAQPSFRHRIGNILGIRLQIQLFKGWRGGIGWCIIAVLTVLVTTLVSAIVAATRPRDTENASILFQGNCQTAENAVFATHLVINVLSTLALGASNYCMQVLSSPTRRDVDRMHAQRKVLEIGINSIWNVSTFDVRRKLIWALLLLSSTPLHLIFNSAIFPTTATYAYQAALVTDAFFKGQPIENDNPQYSNLESYISPTDLSYPTTYPASEYVDTGTNSSIVQDINPLILWLRRVQSTQLKAPDRTNLTNLSSAECVQAYSTQFVTGNANVLLVASAANNPNTSSYNPNSSLVASYYWGGKGGTDVEYSYYFNNVSRLIFPIQYAWPGAFVKVDYCLSEEITEGCTVEASLEILAVILAMVTVKLICMGWMLCNLKDGDRPLVVLGDAVASFVNRPDPYTAGACLAGPQKFRRYTTWSDIMMPWQPRRRRWIRSGKWWQWAIYIVLTGLTMGFCGYLLQQAIQGYYDSDPGAPSVFTTAFTGGDPRFTLLVTPFQLEGLIPSLLLANTPQLVISIIYFLYNTLLTSMLMGLEWSQYAHGRKPLRVSCPVRNSQQRSPYRLQIPYRYGVPLLVAFGTLHYLTSQSIFLWRVFTYFQEFDGTWALMATDRLENAQSSTTTTGYSPYAFTITMVVGGSIALFLPLMAVLRRYRPGMTLVGNNSAAISAACHSKGFVEYYEGEDEGALGGVPLLWGEVPTTGEAGHCCFSAGPVSTPKPGKLYG